MTRARICKQMIIYLIYLVYEKYDFMEINPVIIKYYVINYLIKFSIYFAFTVYMYFYSRSFSSLLGANLTESDFQMRIC